MSITVCLHDDLVHRYIYRALIDTHHSKVRIVKMYITNAYWLPPAHPLVNNTCRLILVKLFVFRFWGENINSDVYTVV